ncbi:MAG: PspC domain-containing protein [Bacteroidales bacterium]|jgi:phage shock protein PspC (stress-responsive transcriptional regulator)
MKKVIKVSINKTAFTLSEEAYNILKVYLDHLRRYYSHDENGNEIVDGIEERIAELLAERTHDGIDVVSKEMVNEILDIMGPLEVIEEESGVSGNGAYKGENYPPAAKKLYRDLDNKVIGGVCAGLSAYFHIDVVIIRLIAVALLFLPNIIQAAHSIVKWGRFSVSFGGFFFFAYIIMWIIIPAALTVEEKYAMRGEPLSAKGVQRTRRTHGTSRSSSDRRTATAYSASRSSHSNRRNSALWVLMRTVAVIVGVFFIVGSSAVLISLVFGFAVTKYTLHFTPAALLDLMGFTGNMFWVKTFGVLALVLPALGFIYLGSVLIFNIRRHKWIGGFLFFTWLISLIGFIITVAGKAIAFKGGETFEQQVPVTLTTDTLYIDLEAGEHFLFERYWLEADASVYRMGWFEGKKTEPGMVYFPTLTLVRQSQTATPTIWVKTYTLGTEGKNMPYKPVPAEDVFQINGNVLSVPPVKITKETPWDGHFHSLKIFVPADHVVIVKKPVYHEFGKTESRKMSVKGVF